MILSFDADPKSSASAPARPYFRQTNAIERSMSERLSRKKVSQFMAVPKAATMRVLDGVAILDEVTPRERGCLARTNRAAGGSGRHARAPGTYFFVTSGMCFEVVSTNDTGTPCRMRCETSCASQFVSRTQPCDDA